NENTITGQAGLTTDEQTQTAKAEGYDGNIQKNISDTAGGEWVVGEDGVAREVVDPEVLKPRTNYVVYDSRQIKSSTENVGTYDATNPDIRYSLREVMDNFKLTKENAWDYEYALMQSIAGGEYGARSDYRVVNGVEIRVKGHTPNWDNFVDWDTDEPRHKIILNVTVGDYDNTDYRRNKTEYEEFMAEHPDTIAVDVTIEDGTYLGDALNQIHEALSEKGADFSFEPNFDWADHYSEENNDLSHSEARYSLSEVNDRFNEELATLTEENARERILNVGTPSPILLACGIEDKPIRLYGAKLLSKVRKHGYKIDDLKNLPLAISSPIAVFEGSKKNSFAILTELRIGNSNVLAALSVGKGGHDVDFNIISSVYDKREDSVARWVNDGKMLWVDKKKALDYFSVSAPIAEAQNNQELISTTKVIQNFENPKIEPKFSLQGSDKSLVGLHNISLDKLRKAIKMGGLANPSVAVIDVDKQTHEDYGEYTLILPNNLVDSRQGKNAGTWAGDAWTPTYPQIIKRMTDDKAISRYYKDINALPEAMRGRMRLAFDSFMEGRSADALAYWYLFEKGDAPALVYIPSRYDDNITNAVKEATNGSFSMYGLTSEERAKCLDVYIAVKYNGDKAAFENEMQARIDRLTEVIETKKSDRVKKWAQDTIDSIKEFGFDYDAVSTFMREVDTDNSRRGQSDVQGTIRLAEDYIKDNNLEEDYQSWRDSLEGRYGVKEYIFGGYTDSGNQRWLPHTTANASKWMKKQGRQGAVATFPSFGTFIAVSIPKMTTLNTIRKRKKLLGRSKEEYDTFREKWENVYFELGQKLQPDAERIEDYGWWRLIEAVSTNNPKEHIKKQYGIELSAEDMQKLNDMLDAIKTNYPARYFETKFERPVELSEFIAAVVPNDIPADVEASLQDASLNVYKYDKGVEGSRQEAVLEATDSPNVRFSLSSVEDEKFQRKTAFLTDLMREYNIPLPTFIAQTSDEFLSMV
ncbi:MAG: hypothetical protein J6J10_06880, partial [Alistipes sp.]|nr:hypothetical protein [Alistipes sp.]